MRLLKGLLCEVPFTFECPPPSKSQTSRPMVCSAMRHSAS